MCINLSPDIPEPEPMPQPPPLAPAVENESNVMPEGKKHNPDEEANASKSVQFGSTQSAKSAGPGGQKTGTGALTIPLNTGSGGSGANV